MLLGTQRINEKNHLEIGGCDTVDLAAEFGTPLYVMDEAFIRERCRAYKSAFEAEYGDAAVAYAGKAFIVAGMCKLIAEEGLWIDVASSGELYTAARAGFPMEHVFFHGNFKSQEEIDMAIDYGVGYVVLDSFGEIEGLSAAATSAGKTQKVLVRCNPGVDPHTHKLISTGQQDSKFGFNIKDGTAMRAVKTVAGLPGLDLKGIHCHLGSQLFDFTPYVEAAPVMTEFIAQVKNEVGIELSMLDLGGGPAARYLEDQIPPTPAEFARTVCEAVITASCVAGIAKPKLFVEPGRSIAAEAGTTLYAIGPIKEVGIPEPPGTRTYMAVDGGLSDNPRPTMYDAVYSAIVATRAGDTPSKTYSVAGRHCETDSLIPSVTLAEAEEGDLLAVQTTGAYNYAMASNYNRFARPAVVFVMDGQARLVVRRETLDDLVSCDVI